MLIQTCWVLSHVETWTLPSFVLPCASSGCYGFGSRTCCSSHFLWDVWAMTHLILSVVPLKDRSNASPLSAAIANFQTLSTENQCWREKSWPVRIFEHHGILLYHARFRHHSSSISFRTASYYHHSTWHVYHCISYVKRIKACHANTCWQHQYMCLTYCWHGILQASVVPPLHHF